MIGNWKEEHVPVCGTFFRDIHMPNKNKLRVLLNWKSPVCPRIRTWLAWIECNCSTTCANTTAKINATWLENHVMWSFKSLLIFSVAPTSQDWIRPFRGSQAFRVAAGLSGQLPECSGGSLVLDPILRNRSSGNNLKSFGAKNFFSPIWWTRASSWFCQVCF